MTRAISEIDELTALVELARDEIEARKSDQLTHAWQQPATVERLLSVLLLSRARLALERKP